MIHVRADIVQDSELAAECPDIETASEDYARRFAGAAGEYFLAVQAQCIREVLAQLRVSSVLDVGGGHGQLVPLFLDLNADLTVYGSTDSTHERVRQAYPRAAIQYDSGRLDQLPYPDQTFDLVVSVRLVSHIEAWEELLAELCRVARYAVVIDYPNWCSLNALTPLLWSLKRRIEKNTRTYESFFLRDLRRVFASNGFRVTDTRNQFFLPMFLHRLTHGSRWLQGVEKVCRGSGLTAWFGSPGILLAERAGMAGSAPDPR